MALSAFAMYLSIKNLSKYSLSRHISVFPSLNSFIFSLLKKNQPNYSMKTKKKTCARVVFHSIHTLFIAIEMVD